MRRALLSVTDKTGLAEFGAGLVELGFSLLSTGGTMRVLREAGLEVTEVADYTGFPEMMDGRVKTLHPKVHGGLLARRDLEAHRTAMVEHGIDPIDLVVVNLYPFRETVAKPGVSAPEIIENIDIGGPSMLRSAAKNHASVAVVVDPQEYPALLSELREGEGELAPETRRRLAGKAFAHTAAYDTAIATWFADHSKGPPPESFTVAASKIADLRYGENPHQPAAFYRVDGAPAPSLAAAKQRSGKELSYNNLLDLDAALGLALEFHGPACAIIKHNNPCGTAVSTSLADAFSAALDADPLSAFGGIVGLNQRLDEATAKRMVEQGTFLEAIVAPDVSDKALAALAGAKWGKNCRVLDLGGRPKEHGAWALRQVSGGLLVQRPDRPGGERIQLTVATKRTPTPEEEQALRFAWLVCKHVKSNAILLARQVQGLTFASVGVGAGQMSRVDSVKIAVEKAGEKAQGAVLASDAFFPFADGLEAAARAGVTAVIQPGGSKRDDEVIAAADAAGVAMVFTGQRHFRH